MKKRRRKIFLLVFIFIILGVVFYLIKTKPFVYKNPIESIINKINVKTKFNNKIEYESNYSSKDFSNFENKTIELLNLYYKSLYYLEVNDFSNYFNSNDNKESYLLNQAVKLQIELRKKEKNDLTLNDASYDLTFLNIEKKNNNYEITVNENAYINFKFMKDITTKIYNIENIFVFDNNYKLISYRRSQDFYTTFTQNLDDEFSKSDIDSLYSEYYNKRLSNIDERAQLYNYYLNNKNYISNQCQHNYDRQKALAYTQRYVIKRSPNWDSYDDYGGNCQNFASQVLYEGGIPKDIYGADIWKYYNATPNNENNKTGRSASWTIVNDFYEYAKNNKGFGLCAEVDVNPFYAEAGDIMQVGNDDFFVHTVVVSGTIIEDNNVIDIIVNSNTNDYENLPISAILVPQIRLIKINGWND